MMPWAQNDALFIEELRAGYEWQQYVAERLRMRGLAAECPPLRIRDRIEDAEEWTRHDADLLCAGRHIDVKSRRLRFTGKHDYPFDTAMIDTVAGWNAKEVQPVAVVLVSRLTGGLAVVPVSTRPAWQELDREDHVRGIPVRSYVVDRELLRPFGALVEWLKGGG